MSLIPTSWGLEPLSGYRKSSFSVIAHDFPTFSPQKTICFSMNWNAAFLPLCYLVYTVLHVWLSYLLAKHCLGLCFLPLWTFSDFRIPQMELCYTFSVPKHCSHITVKTSDNCLLTHSPLPSLAYENLLARDFVSFNIFVAKVFGSVTVRT